MALWGQSGLTVGLAAGAEPPPTKIAAVKTLSADASWKAQPVRLRGVITLFDPHTKDAFMQDDSGAIYLAADEMLKGVKEGDLAELDGMTDLGSFAPIILPQRIRVVGPATLPTPVPATYASLVDGRYDSERVVVEAKVLGITAESPDVRLNLMMAGGRAIAILVNRSPNVLPSKLRRATVRVTGVAAPGHNGQRQATTARLLVSPLDPIEMIQPGSDNPEAIPLTAIGGLLRFKMHQGQPDFVRIQGIVTAAPSSEKFVLEDESGSVMVSLGQEESAKIRARQLGKTEFVPGEKVEVTGGPYVERLSVLFRADEVKKIGRAELPPAVPMAANKLNDPRYNWSRIAFDGRILSQGQSALSGRLELTLKSGNAVLVADVPNSESGQISLAIGSVVRVKGVLDNRNRAEWNSDVSMLHLTGVEDITVLEGPPANPLRLLLLFGGGLGAAGAVAFMWAFTLKRQVRARTQDLAESNASLRASQEWQKLAIEATGLGLWDWDLATGKIAWSATSDAIWGYAPSEVIGAFSNFAARVHPEDIADYKAAVERTLAQGVPFHCEHRMVRPDGSLQWVSSHGKHVRDATGKAYRMIGAVLDITERKRADLALKRSEAEFRAMFELASIGMAQADVNSGLWLRVNQKMCEIIGYTEAELLQRRMVDITHPEDQALDREAFQSVLRGDAPNYQIEKRCLRKNGTIAWVNLNLTVIRDAEGQPTRSMATLEDISERKRLEEQLRQSQKLEAIGQLAGGVAHDFNNILASIMMQCSSLQMNPAAKGTIRTSLSEIGDEARRAASLTRQLLMFSRRAVMDTKPLDLDEVVENLTKMLRRLIGENIKLELGDKTLLPLVEADAGMVEQALMNLVVNARDAMPNGGKINITTSVVDFPEEPVPAGSIRRAGRFVCLAVSDSGCGMDRETMQRIFEPFFTTKETGKGTGLGLATVHGIVAQHEGWVEVDSQVNSGTTFRMYLPALKDTSPKADLVPQIPQTTGGNETILVVEDQPQLRKPLSQILQSHGYVVYEASNGQEAIKLWQTHGTEIDLLLTDMIMPEGMTGLELTERLRKIKPGLKAIISSGYSAEIAQRNAIDQAGIVYLPKPYEVHLLAEAVRKCLDHG